jgi:hypothetical protein
LMRRLPLGSGTRSTSRGVARADELVLRPSPVAGRTGDGDSSPVSGGSARRDPPRRPG